MTIYSRGLLIGRFQPFHKGHLFLLHHVRKKVKKLVIAIGSANVIDEDNPFTYEERKKMIEKVVQEEKLTDFVVRIVPLNDYHNDELWYKQAIQKAVKVDLIIGNNEWTNSIFEKRGHAILRAGFFKRYLYEGEKIRNLIRQKKPWKERVPKYLVNMIKSYKLQTKSYKYHHVAIGGTFDHFHTGHKKLIDTALQYGRIISVGITSESMYKFKNFAESIESFQKRKKSLITYLKEKKSLNRVKFFQLSNIYGSASTDGTMEAIIVSKSTYPNAIRINTLRKENKLPELKIICIKDVKGTDGRLVSSERIRKGEIDREGKRMENRTLLLPEYLRGELRKPLGKVVKGRENELEKTARKLIRSIDTLKQPMVIAVGDIVAMSLEKIGYIPDVKIIDYRSRRQAIKKAPSLKGLTLTNLAGTISSKAASAIKKSINLFLKTHKKQTVVINGEEDLLALPAILFAPLNSIVLYGQIDLGVVMVKVDEKKKRKIKTILDKFTQ